MKKIIKNISYFLPILFKLNPIYLFTLCISSILSALSNLVSVYYIKVIIESFQTTKEFFITTLLKFVLIMLVIELTILLIDLFNRYIVKKAEYRLDEMFNKKLVEIDFFLFEDPDFNKELNYAKECFKNYTSGIYSITYFISNFVRAITIIAGSISLVIFYKNPIIILLIVISLVISYITTTVDQKYGEEYNIKRNEIRLPYWYYTQSIFNFPNQKSLRNSNILNAISGKIKKYCKEDEKLMANYMNKRHLVEIIDSLNTYLINGLIIILLFISTYNNVITIAIFSMLSTAIFTLKYGFQDLIYWVKNYYKECDYLEHYINFMKKESIYKEGTTKIDKINSIEFKDVYFKYPRCDDYVLENISFKLDLNKKISLVGVNGAGKTTIIKLICRFYSVDKGVILINGININELDGTDLLKKLAIVFQDFSIISFSIKDNIEIDGNNKEKLDDSMRKSLFYDRVQELPDKEYTYINKWFDKSGVTFSGGEMQKMAFSRSLYKESSFIILDEPTSSLDAKSEATIYENFREIVGDKPVLYISHRLSSCISSDQIIVLDGKKIVQMGKHSDLMLDKEGIYYKMFTSQSEYYQ